MCPADGTTLAFRTDVVKEIARIAAVVRDSDLRSSSYEARLHWEIRRCEHPPRMQ